MRKYLIFIGFFQLLVGNLFAQNIPNGATGPSGKTPVKRPVVPDASIFYQRVFTPNIPITDSSLVNMSATVDDVGVATQYIDGLGRPLETVVKQASPSKKDFISPTAFDVFGNQSIQYLPYAAQTGNTNDGLFKTSPFVADSAFYKSQFSNEDIYYGQVMFDGSPLNKTIKQMAPGNNWAGSGRGISYDERANAASDSVRIWSIDISSEDDVPASTSAYAAGSLLVKDVTDERGNETISYVDELGRTVLTKTQSSSSPYTGHTGWLCTYYIYDEMSHLRFVISPKATAFLLINSWDLSDNSDVVNNLCYSYWYDSRGRVTEKHIPGKGKTYIAYDLYDHVVMTQDENLRTSNQWAFIKYDGQSRPDTAGLITITSLTAAQVIANAAASTDYPSLTGTYTVLTVNYYDDYSWNTGGSTMPGKTLNTTNINGTNFITSYNTSPYYAQQITQSQRTRGLSTGSQTLVLGTSTYLYTVNIYDDRSRLIQVKQKNFTGGTDISTTQYDFSGKVLRNHLAHDKEGANTITHTLLTKYSYDHAGRLKSIIKNIDGLGDKRIDSLAYNEPGELSSRFLGSGGGGALETQNFTYNIRGWLSSINKDYVEATTGTGTGYFGEEMFYDYGFTTTYYNGNISGVKWKSAGDDIQRAYGFGYDNVNRLTKADFTQQNTGSSSWTSDKMDFSVSGLKYSGNGDITAMSQRGVNVNTPLLIDSLAYTYFTNSNQLEKVKDLSGNTVNLGDFTDTTLTSDDYTYDENGNQTKDNNKHIHTSGGGSGTTYNFLDKPDSIHVNGKGSIIYTYSAAGAVLQKTITDTKLNTQTVITYMAGFVYQKVLPSPGNASTVPDTLQYALHEEGRIRPSIVNGQQTTAFVYDYFLKDHLGNIRSVITDEQDTDAYPIASLEAATIDSEKIYYSGLDTGVVARSTVTGYPTTDSYTSPNDYVQKLKGDGAKIGAGILLKVMAGDTINVHAASWWKSNGAFGTSVSPLADIANAITNSLPGVSGNKYIASQLGGTILNPSISNFITTRDSTYNSSHVDAWLNIVVLDEQLNPVMTNDGNNSYYEQVGNPSTANVKQYNISRPITKSGYVYVYVSDESPNVAAYWDDLQVTHVKGHLLQENSYYPFGLEMKALSSQAALKPQTTYKYNAGTNLESDFDVDYYETPARNYDPQVGRFTEIDAMSEQTMSMTTYQFGGNNPIIANDPSGMLKQYQQKPDLSSLNLNADPRDINIDMINQMDNFNEGADDAFWGQGNSGGWGGVAGWRDAINNGINTALNSENGGKVALDGTFTPFQTQDDAFNWGVNYMTQNNLWNKNGWASSVSDADKKFTTAMGWGNGGNSNFSLVDNQIPDVTARFDKVIEYTKGYFSGLSKILGNRLLGDWDIVADGVFGYLVGPHGKFDIKNSDDPFLGFSRNVLNGSNLATWYGETLEAADFGNYNFGVAANAFGLSLPFALRAAGLAQLIWDRPYANWTNIIGFGDEFRDSEMITLGFLGIRPPASRTSGASGGW